MAGNNGWGATRGGRLPKATSMPLPTVDPMLALMAQQARKGADELRMPVRDFLRKVREAGIADYDDAWLEQIASLADLGHG